MKGFIEVHEHGEPKILNVNHIMKVGYLYSEKYRKKRKESYILLDGEEGIEVEESYEEIKRLIAIALGETIVIDSIKSSGGGVAVGVVTGNMRIDHGKEPTVTNIKSVETLYC